MSSTAATRLRIALEPAVREVGYDLEDVQVRQAGSRRLVQVVVDRDAGLTIDDVAEVARAVSAVLDADDTLVSGAYVLEVTSPGVDRPLTAPRHWRRNISRLVEAHLADGSAVTGRITAADDAAVQLAVGDSVRVLTYDDIAKAQVQVEFSRIDEIPASEERDD
jgi:ribosome maturation factor RimP